LIVTKAFALISPAATVPALIVATDVFDDDQDVVDVTALLLPLEYVALAVQVPEVPSFREEGQEIAILFNTGLLALNVAVTLFAALIVTEQVPVPVHAPLQPEKVWPLAGVAVSVTLVPEVKLAEQVAPQLMPAGKLVTVPLPATVTLRVPLYNS